jgi:hypothetical protein
MLEPETGIALARVIATSVHESTDARRRAEALRLLGEANFRLRDYSQATEILAQSAADFEHAKAEGSVFDWADALHTFQVLSRAQIGCGLRKEALPTNERDLRFAEASGRPESILD